jgi:putative ABC transport system permease protein
MRTPLAWYNLVHHKVRTVAAVAGVMFAVVLIFLQLGFRGTAEKTASLVYEALDFDLLVRSKNSGRLSQSRPIPEVRLYQAASETGVRSVSSLVLNYNRWQSTRGSTRPILVLGVAPDEPVFSAAELRDKVRLLTAPEFLLIDRASRGEFGPQNGREFGDEDIGTEAEIEHRRVRVVGHFLLGTTFDEDGMVVVCRDGFRRLQPGWPAGHVTLGLIRLASGADPAAVASRLKQRLAAQDADDVDVFTRSEVIEYERWVWLWQQSIGMIFTMGVAVAFVVGSVIVYQVLSSDVTNHLPEYATLKAMGYSDGFLSRVVLTQAVILALLGFLPGLAVSQILYVATAWKTRLPLDMTLLRIVGVLGLSLVMCTISGFVALRKLRHAAPADLY